MPAAQGSTEQTVEQFLEECQREYEQTQQELKETDLLIQQTTNEIERLAQRNTQETNRLRQLESSIDEVSKATLQEAYSTVLDTQQRLFTMRGQLEKLQSNQSSMEEYLELLGEVVETVGQPQREPDMGPAAQETEKRPLVVRIIETQEQERRRLSQQMHDGPAQSLTNLILQAEICERLFDSDPERARSELGNLKNAVAATFQKVKRFIINLRPMMLDDLGVVPTLRRYVSSFSENSGIMTNLTVTGKERRLESYKEVTIFRLIQELLNNAAEYSQATKVQVNLDMGEDVIRVSVEDNGTGFEVSDALSSSEAGQLGLSTMRERIDMLGGEIHFDSNLGRGTRVAFELPAG